jgi:hypothetical protein
MNERAMLISPCRIVLFILQIGYIWHLFSNNNDYVQAAASVGSHFIFNNLLQFGFVMLFVRSYFWWAELILVVNFFNLSALYFRHNTHPRFIHLPAVSGPLAWTFVALYWNGAIAVNAHTLPARIVANIAIWGILVYGIFFLVAYKVCDKIFLICLLSLTSHLGLHHGFQPQCPLCFPSSRSILHPNNCLPMDLCIRCHGGFVPRHTGHRCSRHFWQGNQFQKRRRCCTS